MNNVWFACIVVEIDDEAVDASGLTIEDNIRLFENLFPLKYNSIFIKSFA